MLADLAAAGKSSVVTYPRKLGKKMVGMSRGFIYHRGGTADLCV